MSTGSTLGLGISSFFNLAVTPDRGLELSANANDQLQHKKTKLTKKTAHI